MVKTLTNVLIFVAVQVQVKFGSSPPLWSAVQLDQEALLKTRTSGWIAQAIPAQGHLAQAPINPMEFGTCRVGAKMSAMTMLSMSTMTPEPILGPSTMELRTAKTKRTESLVEEEVDQYFEVGKIP